MANVVGIAEEAIEAITKAKEEERGKVMSPTVRATKEVAPLVKAALKVWKTKKGNRLCLQAWIFHFPRFQRPIWPRPRPKRTSGK